MLLESNNIISEMAADLKRLKDGKVILDNQVKALSEQIRQIERRLADQMLNDDMLNFNHAGMTYYLSTKTYASPAANKKDELFQALRENGYGDIVVETVNAQTLASFVKEQRNENGLELPCWLSDLVSVYDDTQVHMRRSPRKN